VLAGLGLVAWSVLADVVAGGDDYGLGWEQKLGIAVGTTMVWVAVLRLAGYSPRRARRASRQGTKHVTPVSA
jgi:hypothetical protein